MISQRNTPLPFFSSHLLMVLAASTLVLMTSAGCATSDAEKVDEDVNAEAEAAPNKQRARHGNLSHEGFGIEEADLNGDERPDQWTLKDEGGVIRRVERDLNFDGKTDMWQYFNASGALIEEEMDLDVDGNIDIVAFYKDGIIARKKLALDFSATFSIEKFYDSKGNLLRVQRDDDGDGKPDIWEYYENQKRVRIGWDTINDGKPDTFDQL